MTKFIALYLPQYHPIPENDQWYGKGFTEWTNVASSKPLFKGHYQPHVPADLGFYDLRLKESRRAQAEMAQRYGISAFCYWTYWFGNGRKLLDMPIWEVYKDKNITLPFCLGWANHSWEKKLWNRKEKNELLIEQTYPGKEDYSAFFYEMLPLLRDERYFRVNNCPFFLVYKPLDCPDMNMFIETWRKLALKEGLLDFYFVGRDSACRDKEKILGMGFNAVYDDNMLNIHHEQDISTKIVTRIARRYLHVPTIFEYKDAIKYMITDDAASEDVIPSIAPNWDHSPRSGKYSPIFVNCEPELFEIVAKKAAMIVSKKDEDKKLVIIKSWNEWGEGNHLEPDLKYGLGYLEALKRVVDAYGGQNKNENWERVV